MFAKNGKCRRLKKKIQLHGGTNGLMCSQFVSEKARIAERNAVLVSTQTYGTECLVYQKKHENRVNAV